MAGEAVSDDDADMSSGAGVQLYEPHISEGSKITLFKNFLSHLFWHAVYEMG